MDAPFVRTNVANKAEEKMRAVIRHVPGKPEMCLGSDSTR